jgi:hypothetical protein
MRTVAISTSKHVSCKTTSRDLAFRPMYGDMRYWLVASIALASCGGTSDHAPLTDGNSGGGDSNQVVDSDAGLDGGTATGVPMTCPGPGNPKHNGGSCGSERWNIKTGTDSQASSVSLAPQPNTIAALDALTAAGGGNGREHPTENTVWELKNVTLTEVKLESDSDYHLVLSDGSKTLIAEIPYMTCATSSAWICFMSRSRSEVDAKYTVSSSPQYPAAIVTVRGVGFFDFIHGQNGVAPNGIELHPVLEICFGHDCTPG